MRTIVTLARVRHRLSWGVAGLGLLVGGAPGRPPREVACGKDLPRVDIVDRTTSRDHGCSLAVIAVALATDSALARAEVRLTLDQIVGVRVMGLTRKNVSEGTPGVRYWNVRLRTSRDYDVEVEFGRDGPSIKIGLAHRIG